MRTRRISPGSHADLGALREQAADLYRQLMEVEAKMDQAAANWSEKELRNLNKIVGIRNRRQKLDLLDASMVEELERLREKLRRTPLPPRPPAIWEALREILAILDKFFAKLIELQRWLPPLPPGLSSSNTRARQVRGPRST